MVSEKIFKAVPINKSMGVFYAAMATGVQEKQVQPFPLPG